MTPVLFVASFYGPKKMLSQRICSLNILSTTLLSALIFILPSVAVSQPSQYFVSASKGNDKNNGLTASNPWASLSRVTKEVLQPGDTVYFKSGDLFKGQLVIDESGTAAAPIHFTAYGKGVLPIIDGAAMPGGAPLAAVMVVDQDHLELSKLNIRNFRKKKRNGVADINAYGILVKNTGKRNLRGYNFHDLLVEEVFPIQARKSFNKTSVSGIRFETQPAKAKKPAYNTGDIYIHSNFLRHTARFGIAVRHGPSKIEGITGTSSDYDVDVRIVNNRCEDTGGSCVLINGVWNGLLEKNRFIRSGAMVEPKLSVNRGSGAWFFRSKNIVAQRNIAIGSRGHNDSAGLHVDYGNENVLVQYNFSFDNEGYGTEILGKNKNVIWRHNVSVHDGTRRVGINRPEGGKSEFPGKTIFVSDFSVPKRIQSKGVYIYNNTYVIAPSSDPLVELNGSDTHLWNNLFVVDDGGRLGVKVTVGWQAGKALDMQGNAFSGNVSPNFIRLDSNPVIAAIGFDGELDKLDTYALDFSQLTTSPAVSVINHPLFPAAGKGIFSHVAAEPEFDIFNNVIGSGSGVIGAGYRNKGQGL
jgi:hypothetical protein